MDSRLEKISRELPTAFTRMDLEAYFKSYKAPGKYVMSLEKKGYLIRLKQNTYCFSKGFDPLRVANSLYSPSYVSFETALSYYNLIPERVIDVTSVSIKKRKTFATKRAHFEFYQQDSELYSLGMSADFQRTPSLLIATKEKAILDTLARANLKSATTSPDEIFDYVVEGLRIDEEHLKGLKHHSVRKMAALYRNRAPTVLCEFLFHKRVLK